MLSNVRPHEAFAVPAYTQAATANGAILMGAKPHIIDVDPSTYTVDFDKITLNCKLVFVTSINGRYPSYASKYIEKLRGEGRFVVEDAAQALGSWHNGKHIGTMGDVGVFSFGAPKIITTGQGGCIVTNRKDLSDQIHAIKNFGRTVGVGEIYNIRGMNFKFTDLQAAFGVEQMRKLPDIVKRKREIFARYQELLSDVAEFVDTDLTQSTPTYPEILVDRRDELAEHLRNNNIGCRAVYYSLSSQPFHSKWSSSTPTTDYIANRGLQLPGQPNLTDDDIANISRSVKEFYK
jgi:perosamine synthetase